MSSRSRVPPEGLRANAGHSRRARPYSPPGSHIQADILRGQRTPSKSQRQPGSSGAQLDCPQNPSCAAALLTRGTLRHCRGLRLSSQRFGVAGYLEGVTVSDLPWSVLPASIRFQIGLLLPGARSAKRRTPDEASRDSPSAPRLGARANAEPEWPGCRRRAKCYRPLLEAAEENRVERPQSLVTNRPASNDLRPRILPMPATIAIVSGTGPALD